MSLVDDFPAKKGSNMHAFDEKNQVFVKFVLDFLMCFAPRNPGKTHEFVVPKKLAKNTKNHSIFAAFRTIFVGKL